MKFRVQLLWRAERDVEATLAWLNERSPAGAALWHRTWDKTVDVLRASADVYGVAPENEGQELEVRQILFQTPKGRQYRALFTIQGSIAYVMHIRGPGQDLVLPDELQLP
jgi:plasmid stabilization system protein ParE